MAKKKTIVTANDANDDWLKKIRKGFFKRQDLAAHVAAQKEHDKETGKNNKPSKR